MAALTAIMLASGCAAPTDPSASGSAPSDAPSSAASPSTVAGTPTSAPVPAQLRFTAATVDGQTFDAAALAG